MDALMYLEAPTDNVVPNLHMCDRMLGGGRRHGVP